MIKLVKGNMFEYGADIRINTVNCVGVMGKGVALVFKKRQPEMFKEYVLACKLGRLRPGRIETWTDKVTGEITINFPTKRHWRDNSKYRDIELGLAALRGFLLHVKDKVLTIPALGCGHGGLDWKHVRPMIEYYLGDLPLTIYLFTPNDSRNMGVK